MELQEIVRGRINEAVARDSRTLPEIAKACGVDYDHFRKVTLGQKWVDWNKLPQIAQGLGVQTLWLLGGEVELPSGFAPVPVFNSRKYAVENLAAATRLAVGQAPNLSDDPKAHWVRLEDTFGEFARDEWILVTPSKAVLPGEPMAAISDGAIVVGVLQRFRDEDCLLLAGRILRPSEFAPVGLVYRHIRKTVQR